MNGWDSKVDRGEVEAGEGKKQDTVMDFSKHEFKGQGMTEPQVRGIVSGRPMTQRFLGTKCETQDI